MATDEETLARLISLHDKQLARLRELDAYYSGKQPLSYMHPELIQQLEGQVRQVVINWPRLVVDAVEERLDVEGFRRPEQPDGDDELWQIWQENDLDVASQRAHVDALALGRSYVTIGTPDDPEDPPVICDESALDMIATSDPRTRKTDAALRRWCSDGDGQTTSADRATLYLPNATIGYEKLKGGAWKPTEKAVHDLDAVPVVAILNRERRKHPLGESEMHDVLPLSDAACKIATDMMVGSNFHAIPRYWAAGVSEQDFTDEAGNPVSVWKSVTGRIWSTENAEAKLGAFQAADLTNFHNTLKALAQLVSSLYGLPPHYLGWSTENPASAEGIKSSEARLVKRAMRKQRAFEDGWEQVMRLAWRIQTGDWDRDLLRLETQWRDASTPTDAQKADAAVKLKSQGIISTRQAREDLGYTDVQIDRMEADDEAEAAKSPSSKLLNQMAGAGAPA